jgi:hypothetical protein
MLPTQSSGLVDVIYTTDAARFPFRRSTMESRMNSRRRQYFQVLYTVICLDAILVMYHFGGRENTSEMLFHYFSMLSHYLAIQPTQPHIPLVKMATASLLVKVLRRFHWYTVPPPLPMKLT